MLKSEEGRNRKEMIAITDSYFEGLKLNTDTLTPFAPEFTRIENGNITANPVNRNIRKHPVFTPYDSNKTD